MGSHKKRPSFDKIGDNIGTGSVSSGAKVFFNVLTFAIAVAALVLGIYSAAVLPNKVNNHRSCSSSSDCNDGNICTVDVCESNGLCSNILIPQCNPFSIAENTLYVSPEWIPAISNNSYYFTTISAALIQAATYTGRSGNNPINIFIYPGTYNENVTLIPDVSLTGLIPQYQTPNPITQISGATFKYIDAVTSFVGITLSNLVIDGAITISFASRGTGAGTTSVNIYNCKLEGTVTYIARPASIGGFIDLLYLHSVDSNSMVLIGDGFVTFDDFTFDGNTLVANNSIEVQMINPTFDDATITQDGGSELFAYDGSFSDVTFTLLNAAGFSASSYIDTSSFTVNSGTTVDVRGSELNTVTFTGTGTVARSLLTSQNVASNAGINTFNLSPPYPSTTFNVIWSQVGGELEKTVLEGIRFILI